MLGLRLHDLASIGYSLVARHNVPNACQEGRFASIPTQATGFCGIDCVVVSLKHSSTLPLFSHPLVNSLISLLRYFLNSAVFSTRSLPLIGDLWPSKSSCPDPFLPAAEWGDLVGTRACERTPKWRGWPAPALLRPCCTTFSLLSSACQQNNNLNFRTLISSIQRSKSRCLPRFS